MAGDEDIFRSINDGLHGTPCQRGVVFITSSRSGSS
jgi:hypothetical protein